MKRLQHSHEAVPFSPRLLRVFAVAALLLVPWVLWVAIHAAPPHHLGSRWNWAWGGLDVGELIGLAVTAYLGRHRSAWVIIAASATASLLLFDAWFDIWTARSGFESWVSIWTASVIELPLSAALFWIAIRGVRFFTPKR
ncbi:MAG TPA: hypothetical protein VFH39_00315 [Candidatus Saccharimonadales bacterium]|nr:hypothetical protein [Candidatus Saccharimonadales bacterium]